MRCCGCARTICHGFALTNKGGIDRPPRRRHDGRSMSRWVNRCFQVKRGIAAPCCA